MSHLTFDNIELATLYFEDHSAVLLLTWGLPEIALTQVSSDWLLNGPSDVVSMQSDSFVFKDY